MVNQPDRNANHNIVDSFVEVNKDKINDAVYHKVDRSPTEIVHSYDPLSV